ncbi:LexA family protein [Mesorhizobium sp. NPDC059025]|uniref:LexA family protein n=1 Tax=unclassified Mesorhizobium TaxID=325217 RepID=UPI003686E800
MKARALIAAEPRLAREVVRQLARERENKGAECLRGSVKNGNPPGRTGGMTARQRDLLMFVKTYINQYGFAPSFEEMKSALGLASKAGIHRMIAGLEERGFLTHAPRRARSIRLVAAP